MLYEVIITFLEEFFYIFFSIPFGSFLIVLGSLIYAPTGNRIGKYSFFTGLFIFTLNNFMN